MGEYWRWPEYRQRLSNKDLKDTKIITAGIDVGSVSSKAVIMLDDEVYTVGILRTGSSSQDTAEKILNWTLEATEIKECDIHYIVGTGYGRVNVPMAKKTITEISCHAKGAFYIWGDTIRTVLDVGGQDIKAIRIDKEGNVVDFLMNDKCAAGTGRSIEILAELVSIPIEQIGEISLDVDEEPLPLNCTCALFAKSEALGLLRRGSPKEKVIAAYLLAMVSRMFVLLKKIGIEKDFVITGGQSKNIGIVKRLEKLIGFKTIPPKRVEPVFAGAIGAALFAKEFYLKCL